MRWQARAGGVSEAQTYCRTGWVGRYLRPGVALRAQACQDFLQPSAASAAQAGHQILQPSTELAQQSLVGPQG